MVELDRSEMRFSVALHESGHACYLADMQVPFAKAVILELPDGVHGYVSYRDEPYSSPDLKAPRQERKEPQESRPLSREIPLWLAIESVMTYCGVAAQDLLSTEWLGRHAAMSASDRERLHNLYVDVGCEPPDDPDFRSLHLARLFVDEELGGVRAVARALDQAGELSYPDVKSIMASAPRETNWHRAAQRRIDAAIDASLGRPLPLLPKAAYNAQKGPLS